MEIKETLYTTYSYPCQQDNLTDVNGDLVLQISLCEDAELPKGIYMNDAGVYEIVFDSKLITKEMLLAELKELNELSGIDYEINFAGEN